MKKQASRNNQRTKERVKSTQKRLDRHTRSLIIDNNLVSDTMST